jgi:CRISPR-associated protein Cmr6
MIPLYSKHSAPASLPVGGNAGLWFDKYSNQWSMKGDTVELAKRAWLATFVTNLDSTSQAIHLGTQALLQEYADRVKQLVTHQGGKWVELHTVSRLLIGMGNASVLENGLSWHPSLGVPYIPGSALKGLVRSAAELLAAESPGGISRADIEGIFGSDAQAAEHHAGSVVFLSALPTTSVRLEADVVTPHYGDYYQKGKFPADWCQPTPILFAAIAEDQPFLIAAIPRRPSEKQATQDCASMLNLLVEALEQIGIGAKTSLGYGLFHKVSQRQAQPSVQRIPSYQAGDVVTATRVEDPKGKGRLWFRAEDGLEGTLVGGQVSVEIGRVLQLEIAAVNKNPPGYNFKLPSPGKPDFRSGGRRRP